MSENKELQRNASAQSAEEEEVEDLNKPIPVRCVVIGDASVGKTSIVNSYAQGLKFETSYNPTIQETFSMELKRALGKSEQNQPNPPIQLTLVDTSGSDDYDALRKIVYRGLNVVIICFSVVSPSSFHRVQKKWMVDRQDYFSKTPVVLVGMKTDLRKDSTTVESLKAKGLAPISTSQGEKLAKEIGADVYVECSALSNTNVKLVFDEAVTSATQAKKSGFFSLFSGRKTLNLTPPSKVYSC